MSTKKRLGWIGLLPLLFFLVIYLGTGIITGDFGSMPLLVGFLLAAAFALLLDKRGEKTSFDDKIREFCKAAGDETIMLMVIIFLLAGSFYSVAAEMGAVSSMVNIGLSLLPPTMILPGLFLIGCILSFSMGTSMGTITALAPIGVGIAQQTDANLAFVMATVIGGAMFGDNLSFISDTTIAATRTQGVLLKDKFRANILVVLPGVIITVAILAFFPIAGVSSDVVYEYSFFDIIPYGVIIISALFGHHVMTVLGIGILSGGIVGLVKGSFSFIEFFSVLHRGMVGMEDLIVISIVVGGLAGLMKYYGGVDFLLQTIRKRVKSKKGGLFGIASLVALIDASVANNTIAIITAGPLAKDIAEEYEIDPRRTASLLDIFSSAFQGMIPYTPQLLLAAGFAGLSPVEIMPFSIYPITMVCMGIISILFDFPRMEKK